MLCSIRKYRTLLVRKRKQHFASQTAARKTRRVALHSVLAFFFEWKRYTAMGRYSGTRKMQYLKEDEGQLHTFVERHRQRHRSLLLDFAVYVVRSVMPVRVWRTVC